MKNTIKTIAIALVVFGFASNAAAQIGVSDGAYAEAHIITPLLIENTVDMDFGNVGVIDEIGTIVLSTASTRLGTGGATPATPTGIVTAAEFDITGADDAQVYVTIQGVAIEDATINVIHTNLTDFMIVDTFITDPVPDAVLGIILTGGFVTLFVGATLHTGISQLAGDYHTATDFIVTVNYQ